MTTNAAQSFPFQAEVSQILDLVIHSLYGHKEVFLRELISNASDALDKLRFRSLTEPELLGEDASLEIRISIDPDAGVLVIEDTGVGMTHDELAKNLGTIAHSGTRAFLEAMKKSGKSDASLIGQFGVGFYSAYLVADRVEVTSHAAGVADAWRWSSDAKASFEIAAAEQAARGTTIRLHLKSDQREFLEDWRLKDLIRRYSDFVGYPINLKIKDTWETVNRASALWQRSRSEITEEQHAEFFKHLTHDEAGPLARTHFTIEGVQVFTALLYIPKAAPLFDFETEPRGVRLFVKRVLIMDDCRELLPKWMRFVRGVIDSDDLPLNVSREMLQESAVVRTIKGAVTKKVLDLLDEIAKERPHDYSTFWNAWGVFLKEASATEWEYRERIAKLLRFASSKGEGMVSLEQYVARMPLRQEAIYYVLGESEKAVAAAPHIEALGKRGFEVLYLTQPIDEWALDALREFDKKPLVSAMRADLKIEASEDEKKAREAKLGALAPLVSRAKDVLKDVVADVRTSDRLTDSPCCLVVGAGQHHPLFEQALRAAGRAGPPSLRVLEINPEHPLIVALGSLAAKDAESARVSEWVELLYDQALLVEGSRLPDPARFARRMTDLLAAAATSAASG